ncbi:hypothetical protein MXB_4297 [Myxobolus squamalis]|nr:hypothetical protein MXB_4297 [Myxobolus squamalis]
MDEDKYSLFVGNLPKDTSLKELKRFFSAYSIVGAEVRDSRTTSCCFGYIEFKHRKDAKKALENFQGKDFEGLRVRLDYKKLQNPRSFRSDGYRERQKNIEDYKYLCKVIGIPKDMSWKDLKMLLRNYCTSEFCDVGKDGIGYAAFFTEADMNFAIRKFSKTVTFHNVIVYFHT